MIEGKVIYAVENGKVKILERVREGRYYKVSAGNHIGFIHMGNIIP